jgi:hypothetical protein
VVDLASNRNEYSESSLGGKARLAPKVDNLTAICDPIVHEMWDPRRHATVWASTDCYGYSIALVYFYIANNPDYFIILSKVIQRGHGM